MEEKGRLLGGRNGVDAVEGEAEEAITGILHELRADGLCGLNRLARDGCATDRNGVGEDVAAGRAAIAIGDGPGVAA